MRTTRHLTDWALVLAFVGILWLPVADLLFSIDPAPPTTENRRQARMPQFSMTWSCFRGLVLTVREYGDFFGFRNALIRWHTRLDIELWGKRFLAGKVIRGNEGWLYLGFPETLADWTGTALYTNEELVALKEVLEARYDWLLNQGSEYLFVIVPNKQTIYPEFYPSCFGKRASDSRLDQLVGFLRAGTSIRVLDLRSAFLESKTRGMLYRRTDTHWTNLGAAIATREIALTLSGVAPQIYVPDLGEFTSTTSRQVGGDLARMLSLSDALAEDVTSLTYRAAYPMTRRDLARSTSEANYLYVLERPVPSDLPKAVIVGDSFADGASRFLALPFSSAVFVYGPRFEAPVPQTIVESGPDVVVQVIVERYLRLPQLPTPPG